MVCLNALNLISIGDCSNKLTVNISNEVLRKITSDVQSNLTTINNTNVVSISTQKVDIVGWPGNINISQIGTIKVDSKTQASQTNQTTILRKLQTSIENSLKQKMEQTLGVLAVGSPGFKSYTNFTTKLKTIIDDSISSNQIYNDTKNFINITSQDIKIYYKSNDDIGNDIIRNTVAKNGTININQNSITEIYVQATIAQAFSYFNQSDELVDFANTIQQELKQEVKGFDAIVDSIMDFFKSWIYVIMIVLVVLIIAGVAIWYFFLQNPENVKTIAGAATDLAKSSKGKGL